MVEIFEACLDGFCGRRCDKIGIGRAERGVGGDEFDAVGADRGQRAREGRSVLHENHLRFDEADDVFQLVKICAHRRIGGRHGHSGDACEHCAVSHQRMFDGIARQDHQRCGLTKPTRQQSGGNGVDALVRFTVGKTIPCAEHTILGRCAHGEPCAVRRFGGPFAEGG